MSLTLRQTKGSKLTIQEMDDNLTYLESLITSLSDGWIEEEIIVTQAELRNLVSSPKVILSNPGADKYYEFEGVVEYIPLFSSYGSVDTLFIGTENTNVGTLIKPTLLTFPNTAKAVFFSCKASSEIDGAIPVTGRFVPNERIVLFPWNGGDTISTSLDPDNEDGYLKVKIKYRIRTFG